MFMRISARQIELFQMAYRRKSTRKAAVELNISQPAISRAVADLEAEIGVALFDRSGRRFEPTAAAHSLQEAVQKLLAARLHAKEKRAGTSAEDGGSDTGRGSHDGHGHDDDAAQSYWTCGMHPNVVQDGPGTCPICGMDLTEKKR